MTEGGPKVLFAVAECAPMAQTGGLGEVARSLPPALVRSGCDVRVLMPAYRGVIAQTGARDSGMPGGSCFGGAARLFEADVNGVRLLLLDAPHLFDRPGSPYHDENRVDWPDNDLRFAALSRMAARIGTEGVGDWRPDILHLNDWHTAPTPLWLEAPRPATLLTIHNMAYQGVFPAEAVRRTGLPDTAFTREGYEFWGQVSFLKAGLVSADALTTVSETYARELLDPAFGMGLEGVIADRADALTGVLNGIDLAAWVPDEDPAILPFTPAGIEAREGNRRALAEHTGLDPSRMIFGVVSRLTQQKGLDLLLAALPEILRRGGQLAVMGHGDVSLEQAFSDAAMRHPDAVHVRIGYEPADARRLLAGCDAVIVPSRFEPCGLTQLHAMRYGALPLVARTGGLADTVIDANPAALLAGAATGFQFAPGSLDALRAAVARAIRLFADRPRWQQMQRNAMAYPAGWEPSAQAYRALYERLRLQSSR